MPVIDGLRPPAALLGQQDQIVFIHGDVAGGAQDAHGAADAGLGKFQLVGDVDRAHRAVFLFEHEDCLQIVFTGFLNFQTNTSPFQKKMMVFL